MTLQFRLDAMRDGFGTDVFRSVPVTEVNTDHTRRPGPAGLSALNSLHALAEA